MDPRVKPVLTKAGLFLLLLMANAAFAATPAELAGTPYWLDLLHINQGGTWHGRGRSYVEDDAFFLATDGRADPLAELQADVTAFTQAGDVSRCRFPARYQFLAGQLGWQETDPFARCGEYLAWRKTVPDQQVVLAFPASYLNSPSSMFGHVFLRLDASTHPDAVLESWAVSFSAHVDMSDNSFFYAFKGIVGSYPGYFSVTPYADKLLEYNHLENRDIWEYRLSLTPAETARLVDHLWELRNIRLGYYFFDENCAYRLLELVQVGRPETPLLTRLRLSEAPVAAVRELEANGFVVSRHYRPSKEVSLRWQAAQLPAAQQELAKALVRDAGVGESVAYTALDPQARFEVASLAYDYQRYRHRIGARDEQVSGQSMALLRLMHANSAGVKPLVAVPVPVAPDLGHRSNLFAATAGQRDGVAFTDVSWRYTYHDLIDNQAGFLQGAEIKGLDLKLRTYVDRPGKRLRAGPHLQALTLIDIRSLSPRDRFVKPVSWYVEGGLDRVETDRERLARYLEGGPGLSWRQGDFQPYAFAKVRLENNSAYAPLVETGGGGEAGLLYYHGDWSARLAADGLYFHNGEWRQTARLGLNYALGRNDALRLDASHVRDRAGHANEGGLSWRHYFGG